MRTNSAARSLAVVSLVVVSAASIAPVPVSAQPQQAVQGSLESIASEPVASARAVGLVAAVVHGADTLLLQSYGRANLEWDVPMDVDAVFEVGSIAKQFTAAAILQLRDAGTLELDTEVSIWIPEVGDAGAGVTLRQLLSHTSGIHQFDNTPEWERQLFNPAARRDAALDLLELEPRMFGTGEAQAYSNAGFWLLGLVVERASGMSLEDYFRAQIFEPLGMTRSMYCDGLANVPFRAHGYSVRNETLWRAVPVSYAWVFAPGAVCSTAGDLVTWLQALHGGRVLSPESYVAMTTAAELNDGSTVQYGMGIKVGETAAGLRYVGHGGTAPGFRADATWYPDSELAVVVLINTSPARVSPGAVGSALARSALSTSGSAPTRYTGDTDRLVGTYEHAAGGNRGGLTFEVSDSPEGLSFSLNGSRPQVLPWTGGLTFYAGETIKLTFRVTEDGTELRRDDAGNHYIFRRR